MSDWLRATSASTTMLQRPRYRMVEEEFEYKQVMIALEVLMYSRPLDDLLRSRRTQPEEWDDRMWLAVVKLLKYPLDESWSVRSYIFEPQSRSWRIIVQRTKSWEETVPMMTMTMANKEPPKVSQEESEPSRPIIVED